MGCTETLTQRPFDEWRAEQIEREEFYLGEWKLDESPDADETLKALQNLAFDEWRRRVPSVLASLYDFSSH